MQTIGAFEAKTHLSALLDKVEQGEIILITKHGKPVAKLMPIVAGKLDIIDAILRCKNFQTENKLILSMDWKTLRDEGRK